ncbi:MAG TPA: GNAT family protein [Actinomycetota bacterium]|jgi:ribosomal-protein-serine acetyltransferase|nr:GNAT family protein [Actinomycetota bacterium]
MTTQALFHRRLDEEIELRALDEPDAEVLFELTDRNRDHLRAWLPWVDGTRTVDDTLAFIRSAREQEREGEGFQAGIWYRRELAGVVGYHRIDWPRRRVALGYWLGKEFEGKGIMTRACHALVDHALGELALERVEIRAATKNLRSRAVPLRLGFDEEGMVRRAEWLYDHFVDHVVYGMSRARWPGLNQAPPSG